MCIGNGSGAQLLTRDLCQWPPVFASDAYAYWRQKWAHSKPAVGATRNIRTLGLDSLTQSHQPHCGCARSPCLNHFTLQVEAEIIECSSVQNLLHHMDNWVFIRKGCKTNLPDVPAFSVQGNVFLWRNSQSVSTLHLECEMVQPSYSFTI